MIAHLKENYCTWWRGSLPSHLQDINEDILLWLLGAAHIFQDHGVVDTLGIRLVQIIRVGLVPLLEGEENLVPVRTHYLNILKARNKIMLESIYYFCAHNKYKWIKQRCKQSEEKAINLRKEQKIENNNNSQCGKTMNNLFKLKNCIKVNKSPRGLGIVFRHKLPTEWTLHYTQQSFISP